jgi:hypothetical protein
MPVHAPSLPRPDLDAYREALSLPLPQMVGNLANMIGRKLTAYIGSAKDVRAVDRWIAGSKPQRDIEVRLRLAYRIVKMLTNHGDSNAVVQAWLMGLNPELNDRVPIRLIKEGDLDKVGADVVSAARAFLAGG